MGGKNTLSAHLNKKVGSSYDAIANDKNTPFLNRYSLELNGLLSWVRDIPGLVCLYLGCSRDTRQGENRPVSLQKKQS